jgi:hypothetical protein
MALIIGLALGLILAGLAMAYFAEKALGPGILAKVVRITGIVLVIIGLILLFTPVIVRIDTELRSMLGHN